jgi:hypothetical protein
MLNTKGKRVNEEKQENKCVDFSFELEEKNH